MISKYQLKNINWVNIEKPKQEEVSVLFEEYPHLIPIKDQIFQENFNKEIHLKDIDVRMFSVSGIIFIVGEKILITIHGNEKSKAFSLFTKEVEMGVIENKNNEDVDSFVLKLLKIIIKENTKDIEMKDHLIKNLQDNAIIKTQKIKKLYFYQHIISFILLIFIILYVIKIL